MSEEVKKLLKSFSYELFFVVICDDCHQSQSLQMNDLKGPS